MDDGPLPTAADFVADTAVERVGPGVYRCELSGRWNAAVRWMRFRRTPSSPDGSLDPLALVALSDTMPPAIGQRLGPGSPFFFAPSCDLTAHVFATTCEEWLLLRARCRRAGEGYASGECEIWSCDGHLLVYATQLMYLRLGRLPG